MSNEKYRPRHIDFHDGTLRKIVEEALSPEMTSTHYVSHVVRLEDGKWLVRLEYSVAKAAGL